MYSEVAIFVWIKPGTGELLRKRRQNGQLLNHASLNPYKVYMLELIDLLFSVVCPAQEYLACI